MDQKALVKKTNREKDCLQTRSTPSNQVLLPKLCALDLPAPTKEQQLYNKRLQKENLKIAKQQAENRQEPTQKDYRVGYEKEMSKRITLSGSGTCKNNPWKTCTGEEAAAALRRVKQSAQPALKRCVIEN